MRVLITGGRGQLATALVEALGGHLVASPSREELDITTGAAVSRTVVSFRPDVVINTAAVHQVDRCEADVARALEVNSLGAWRLASACREADSVMVQLSTDYVFDGGKGLPYLEDDLPNPLNVYGATKLAAEQFVQTVCPRHFVIRTSGLFGRSGPGERHNFVQSMLRLADERGNLRVVTDQFFSPTFAEDLAASIVALLSTEAYGIYHVTNSGQCSWYQFAELIFSLAGRSPDLQPVTSTEFGGLARRPVFSVLGETKLTALGMQKLGRWEHALLRYIQQGHPELNSTTSPGGPV